MAAEDFYVHSPYDFRYSEKLATNSYWVCTTCFDLTSLGQDYQHCKCEPKPDVQIPNVDCPSGFLLCALCARNYAGGLSRWSWLVCNQCKSIAAHKRINGWNIPIGRHSLMNQISWPTHVDDQTEREKQVNEMVKFVDYQKELLAFGKLQSTKLFLSKPELKNEHHVSLFRWRAEFPISEDISKAAVVAFRRQVREKLKVLDE